jgi:hypothetical protein
VHPHPSRWAKNGREQVQQILNNGVGGRVRAQQAGNFGVHVNVGPMNTRPTPNEAPVAPLLMRRLQQAREPSERS